eukprot:635765-Rhodomonas_salina.1
MRVYLVVQISAQLLHSCLRLEGPVPVALSVEVRVDVLWVEERVAEDVLEVGAPEVVALVDVVVGEVEIVVVEAGRVVWV